VLLRLAQIAPEMSTFRGRMGRLLLVAAVLAALAVAQSVVVTVRPRFFFRAGLVCRCAPCLDKRPT
jgi:hypothetical protein